MDKIIAHLRSDSTISALIDQNTLKENRSTGNVYNDLIRSITGQQLSVKVAKVIYGRFLSLFGGIEPSPEELVRLEIEDLRAVGYSKQKASYVFNVGHFFHNNPLDFDYWQEKEDQEIIKNLTEIKGVGKWTVEMILMFTLEREDVLPLDDYGIQVAIKRHYNVTAEKKELKTKMLEIAEPWRPYRTTASRYLWASLNNEPVD